MAAQSSFEFISVVGGVRRYFQHNRARLELIFFVLEGGRGVLSTFLLDNSSFSAPPTPDNYCTVPKTRPRLAGIVCRVISKVRSNRAGKKKTSRQFHACK